MDLAPDATTPSKLTPEYPPNWRTTVARFARERKWILFPTDPGSFGTKRNRLYPALWPIGRSQQPRRLSHQCLQIVGFQFFLKLPADVHHRLVTDAQLLSDCAAAKASVRSQHRLQGDGPNSGCLFALPELPSPILREQRLLRHTPWHRPQVLAKLCWGRDACLAL